MFFLRLLCERGTRLTLLQSPTQAWSASCMIDLYHDAKEFQEQYGDS